MLICLEERLYSIAMGKRQMKVDILSKYLRNIREKGWSQDKTRIFKKQLRNFEKIVKGDRRHPIMVLTKKLNEFLDPYLEVNAVEPSAEALSLMQNTIEKLQEVINLNIISEEETVPYTSRHTLIIGLKDKQLVEEISEQVKYFGYACIACATLNEILKMMEEPDEFGAIILDTEYCPARDPTSLNAISKQTPIIFISQKDDVATRLFAVKAGGQAYFVRPLEFTSLLEKIDEVITPPSESPPYRILIIEDSRTQAMIVRQHLEQAGMITEVLIDPLKVTEILSEFQPDLILMDLYMPLCSGIELAKVIRQQDPFVSIPIVFLSAEEDTNKQLSAMSGGGDDFLTKPISPDHLIAAVVARAVRSRTLRAEMIEDSLTGLLNHTRILEQLDLEITRSKRNRTPLSFAMIDIDFFKIINDSHGHPVGDRVIKGLARLLKQRLRKMDSIGRYGGEEFAIIFPQTEGPAVFKKLEEIRRGFSKLLHRSSDPLIEFSATFSIGLAELSEEIDTVDKLVQAADKALYLAKEKGRNCTVLYNNQPSIKN